MLSKARDFVHGRLESFHFKLRRSDLSNGLLGFAVFFVVTFLLAAITGRSEPRAVEQPLPFNHRLHVQDVGLDCDSCHESYESEAFSGLPDREDCAFCHEETQGETAQEQELADLLASGRPLDWQLLFEQPAHVYYSHRRHVTVAGLACETCHGDFGALERPPGRVASLTMDNCIACHERESASIDCSDCHR